MRLGYIGLGKMGKNMVKLMLEQGIEIVAFNRSLESVKEVEKDGAIGAYSYEDIFKNLDTDQRIIWLMVPHGAVDQVLTDLKPHLKANDIVIDGGNSNYKDTLRRGKEMEEMDIVYMDAGVSGGPWGARHGACLLIGGDKDVYNLLEPIFQAAAAPDCYQYLGKLGAGHFAKMVHNGIEYGMMQAIGEGMNVIRESDFDFSLKDVARIYNCRSVIESRLVNWLHEGYEKYGEELEDISGEVTHSGEGQWTIETAKEMGLEVPVIEESFNFRVNSKGNPSYTGKVVSMLRNMFGGHDVSKDE
ncbi:MAG: decarboxylating 6-phosphogluconate dehydrogenase [Candidatus Pacebacteria bacterium]|nr:decarboxylating 6-phosphogluconate dehydrogenase [Candidatus Paceibacterota bacterium]